MAFVVVTHQHPGHTTLLPEILAKHSKLPVLEATDGIKLAPNHVYVTPSAVLVGVLQGRLRLIKTPGDETRHLPIDFFFRSLAADQRELAVGIVLSGTGTDGTLGLRAIKAEAGLSIVQEPQSARYAGMPASAMATGLVDFILKPAAMPARLIAYFSELNLHRGVTPDEDDILPWELLQKVLLLLRARTRHDFSAYKPATIRRRIVRRMSVHEISAPADYLRYLQQNPAELDLMFKEFLISVTSFFRDRTAWNLLRDRILPDLLRPLPDNYTFRVWVPGCATGEEAYSIAILLREVMDDLHRHFNVQVFGTDLDLHAIETARSGVYPEGIAADVPALWLTRHFRREGHHYQISKEVRQMVIFAPHNLIGDPPFTKLDLVSCRNLMIYLNSDLQKRLLRLFHYALKPGGLLFLGSSETVGDRKDLFQPLDRTWKIFSRRKLSAAGDPGLPSSIPVTGHVTPAPAAVAPVLERGQNLRHLVDQVLLRRCAPATVLVDDRGEILYIHGRTGQYLEPAAGDAPRLNILDMAREGLEIELRAALRQAARKRREVSRQNLRIRSNGHAIGVDLAVVRLEEPPALRGLLLVMLRPSVTPAAPRRGGRAKTAPQQVDQLLRELKETKESLRTTVAELATSNEDLRSANEELQSTNEEMQSTNEELETSREELQALNEELTTVNSEQQARMEDLSRARDDMQNLLNSTGVTTLFLDNELRIRRFTKGSSQLFKLLATDVGRPISDQSSTLKDDHFAEDCREVLHSLQAKEREVETKDGRWYWMRLLPYRTMEKMIDGLVITFVDITKVTLAERTARAAQAFFQGLVETVREPVLVLDDQLRLISANRAFYEAFQLIPALAENKVIDEIAPGGISDPGLRPLLEQVRTGQTMIEDFKLSGDFPRLGHREFVINARRLEQAPGLPGMILLAVEDRTGK